MKPKLLVFTSTFPRWENDTDPPFVYELSRRLTADYDIVVHAPHYPGSKTKEVMDGMDIHRFRYFFSSFEKLAGTTGILPTLIHNRLYYGIVPFFLLAQYVSLFLLVRKIRPDIIHAHWIIPQGFIAVLVSILTGVPIVVTAHGADIFGLHGRLFERIKRFTLNRVVAVTVVSKALAIALGKIMPPDIQPKIIPMGVDSKIFRPSIDVHSIEKKFTFCDQSLLYVGRLTEKKGVRYLVDAMPIVLQDFPDVNLLIVGGGELSEDLQKQVFELGLCERINFVGCVTNSQLPAFYTAANVFVGPSIQTQTGDTEGFGLTFVEAALSGCLVIGTNVGGIKDIIQDGITGFLVPERDEKALAQKIICALKYDIKRTLLTKKAREHCMEKFDWSVVARKYSELLLHQVCEK